MQVGKNFTESFFDNQISIFRPQSIVAKVKPPNCINPAHWLMIRGHPYVIVLCHTCGGVLVNDRVVAALRDCHKQKQKHAFKMPIVPS